MSDFNPTKATHVASASGPVLPAPVSIVTVDPVQSATVGFTIPIPVGAIVPISYSSPTPGAVILHNSGACPLWISTNASVKYRNGMRLAPDASVTLRTGDTLYVTGANQFTTETTGSVDIFDGS